MQRMVKFGPAPPIMAAIPVGPGMMLASSSSPVSTATTPGAWRAAAVSTLVIRPCAIGLRTKAACSMPGSATSST